MCAMSNNPWKLSNAIKVHRFLLILYNTVQRQEHLRIPRTPFYMRTPTYLNSTTRMSVDFKNSTSCFSLASFWMVLPGKYKSSQEIYTRSELRPHTMFLIYEDIINL